MFSKILCVALLAMSIKAQGYGKQQQEANSYISYTQGSSSSLGGYQGSSSGGSNQGGSSYISYSQGGASLGIGHAVPVFVNQVQAEAETHKEEEHGPAKYSFKYGVEDKHTGDIKQHEETRDGDVVKGSYSLHEPDGTILTVHYTATKKGGFNAVVQRQGHAAHPQYSSHK